MRAGARRALALALLAAGVTLGGCGGSDDEKSAPRATTDTVIRTEPAAPEPPGGEASPAEGHRDRAKASKGRASKGSRARRRARAFSRRANGQCRRALRGAPRGGPPDDPARLKRYLAQQLAMLGSVERILAKARPKGGKKERATIFTSTISRTEGTLRRLVQGRPGPREARLVRALGRRVSASAAAAALPSCSPFQ